MDAIVARCKLENLKDGIAQKSTVTPMEILIAPHGWLQASRKQLKAVSHGMTVATPVRSTKTELLEPALKWLVIPWKDHIA